MPGPPRRYAARPAPLVVVTVLALLVWATAGCSPRQGEGWEPIGPPLATSVGSVVTLSASGERLVAGLTSGDPDLVPTLAVWSGGAWRELPVTPTSPYAKLARWQSIAAGPDGALLAVGGAHGGAHANIRWTVWTGTDRTGLTEAEQPFGTFGGWGAGDQIGGVITGAGPLLVGSWEGARTGLDLAIWLPRADVAGRWERRPAAGPALESTPELMTGGRSVAPWGQGALISGSVLHLGAGVVRQAPALWRSSSGGTGWTRIDLPDGGSAGEATGAACAADHCTVQGWVDGRLAVWRVEASGAARRLDGIPAVAVGDRDVMPAPALLPDGRAVLLVSDRDDVGHAVVVREPRDGAWTRRPGPRGQVLAFAVAGSTLYAVCRTGDSPVQVWRAQP